MTLQRRSILASVLCGALGPVAYALVLLFMNRELGSVSFIAGFVSVSALSWWAAERQRRKGDLMGWQADPAVFVAAFVLLPAGGVATVFFFGTLIGHVLGRRPLDVLIFNTGQRVVAASVAVAATSWFAPAGSPVSGKLLVGAAVASLVFTVMNEVVLGAFFTYVGDAAFFPAV